MNELLPIETVSWEQLQGYVYDVDGSWRDICVLDTTREDWKKWAYFVNANYRVIFTDECEQDHEQINFAEVIRQWESNGNYLNSVNAVFFVGEIGVKCHFFNDNEIENDIDPSQIVSEAAHLQLMDYLMRLSQALGKEVVLTPENDKPGNCSPDWPGPWLPLLSVNGEQVRVQAYWLGAQ